MKQLLYIIVILFGAVGLAQEKSLFDAGNTLYNEGKYAEAIDKYKQVLDAGMHSEALYFNLANANYKLNNIAPSIYYYEKALQLAPNDKEIKNNLSFAQNMTIDAIDTIPQTGLSRIFNNVTNVMEFDNWAIFAVVFMVLFVVLYLVYYFSYSTAKKRVAFVGSLLVLFFSLTTLGLAFRKYNLDANNKPAIVFVEETQVKSEPNLRSQELFKLHEGTKVQILDTVSNWKKIKLSDGKTGWISKADIKAL
ncbi:tetratricopeptide repeat protein [Mangrovimonas aestuarii]|uniref:tetratricopeptide repeat protein n=1 Tax=Mangrovimonas aestuarii TaxID=3018443 RepID=UPI0023795EE5|nr:tetratricopeptide repeat protein [Mangrovimonas aestuarii]